MAFERARFGDGSPSGRGNVTQAVSNHYNRRFTGKTSGVSRTAGYMNELTLDIDGDMVSKGSFELVAPTIPSGAFIEDVYVVVEEAFSLSGTSPAIEVGTEGSEVTNGFTISQSATPGVYDLTGARSGTWTRGFTANTTVGVALSGNNAASTSAGKLRVVIRYVDATT